MAGRRFRWLIAATLAISPAFAPAADLPPEPKSAPSSVPAPKPPSQSAPVPTSAPTGAAALASPDATCLEWTDGCRTCRKPPAGETACSNVGIACQPQATRCIHQPEKPQ